LGILKPVLSVLGLGGRSNDEESDGASARVAGGSEQTQAEINHQIELLAELERLRHLVSQFQQIEQVSQQYQQQVPNSGYYTSSVPQQQQQQQYYQSPQPVVYNPQMPSGPALSYPTVTSPLQAPARPYVYPPPPPQRNY
jgi:hypothetical protein